MELLSSTKCFGGLLNKYSHSSSSVKCDMKLNVFIPPAAANQSEASQDRFPILYFLSGLTCTEDNFMQKASPAMRAAAQHGLFLVAPDTSPRGCNVEGESESWDLGIGAGFYVDATEQKWSGNYRMYSYIVQELPALLANNIKHIDTGNASIFGHSMGGHGALTIFLKNSEKFKSVSAFAPIANPINCPWGQKAFSAYLGTVDRSKWLQYDATELAKNYQDRHVEILIDQGSDDKFLKDGQLLPQNFVDAAAKNGRISVDYRLQEGYDHGYYFITTFVEDHVHWHASKLVKQSVGK